MRIYKDRKVGIFKTPKLSIFEFLCIDVSQNAKRKDHVRNVTLTLFKIVCYLCNVRCIEVCPNNTA